MERSEILDEVLGIYSRIEELQEDINKLCEKAEAIEDAEDDKAEVSYIEAIKSYKVS